MRSRSATSPHSSVIRWTLAAPLVCLALFGLTGTAHAQVQGQVITVQAPSAYPADWQHSGNFANMVELARAHGIRVVLSSVIPVHNYTPAAELTFPRRSPDQIAALNRWLKSYAASTGSVFLDYAAAMSDDKGMLRRELADDGLQPNKAGYAVMGPLVEQAIAKALGGG